MKKIRLLSLYFCLFLCLVLIAANKKPSVTKEDKTYIDSFLHEFHITETPEQVHSSFEAELSFIENLQTNVVASVKHQEISNTHFGSVKYYFENKKGFCYDRAVLMEKVFKYYHFNFRHVFVYYVDTKNEDPSMADFFKKSTGSHALTEVETQKGWMVTDSNADCIGVNTEGQLYTIEDLKKQIESTGTIRLKKNCTCGDPFWMEHPHFKYVYGLYSRNGNFFSRIGGIPEINIRMLLYNIF